jgi:hypothetical protein
MAEPAPNEDARWWSNKDPAGTLVRIIGKLNSSQSKRRDMNVHHLRLYADRDLYGASGAYGFGGGRLTKAQVWQQVQNSRRPRLSVNVIRNMCNAATSMLSRSRPKPTFTTDGGDWETWRRACKQSQFIEAVYNAENTHGLAAKMAQHGCILGTGAIKVVRDYANKKPRHELAYIGELLVDETEAVYGQPRSMFQVRAIDKLVLKEMYAGERGAEAAIDKASVVQGFPRRAEVADCAMVVEAWHLASGPDSKDGRYMVCTDAGKLYQSDYKHENFPFVFWRWEEDPLGFYGTGIASELTGIQYEINETIRNIQANWWSGGNLKILVERGSKVHKAQLSNDLRGIIVEYTGTPPQWVTTEAVAPGLVQYLEFLIEQAYNITGISQLTAQSQTPFAAMSGKARLVHENSESLRFLPAQRRLEQCIGVDLGYRTLEACEDIYDESGDFDVLYQDRKFLKPMSYSEIRAEPGTYTIQCYPTSILPSTPAGRFTMIEAWEAKGWVTPDESKRLADIPDLKREMDIDQAPRDFVDDELSRIVRGEKVSTDGPVFPPEPDQPIDLVIQRTVAWIYWARSNGAPDEILEQLRIYRDSALAIQQNANKQSAALAAAATPPPPMPPGMPPPGAPPMGAPLPQLRPGVA